MSSHVLIHGLMLSTKQGNFQTTKRLLSQTSTKTNPKIKAHLPLQHIVALIKSFLVRKDVLFNVQLIHPAPRGHSFDLSWGSVRNGLTVREFLLENCSINVDNTQHLQQSLVMTDVRRHTRLTADDDVNRLRGNTRLVVMLEKANW